MSAPETPACVLREVLGSMPFLGEERRRDLEERLGRAVWREIAAALAIAREGEQERCR
jgi:hypothetical protein